MHFTVDFVTVVTAGFDFPEWLVELEVIAMEAVIAGGIAKIYKKDEV